MKQDEKKKSIKKAYEKPVLRVVNITGGIQTLATGCKFSFGTIASPGSAPCIANYCAVAGS
jgi:hypothetical protein